ncbi:group II truncated hemoglobin [Chondromyces apiculatus]|uniref:Hemoglobin-like protein HbO n=1 Tax=Chondromyces apiculatus DSM 436 TaxID=1192034 RepID=A0A017TCU9_9BACT|nr:group II truncated hemoglobin [Chondromyces apiculatus]EYF06757.1 Hemoglobin-like protein HbO [Chondromyces apiculatus DSM 436]
MSSPGSLENPYDLIGGAPVVRKLVEHFYDAMERTEPELTRLHACDAEGRVSRESRDRFALFLIGWLGGPQAYTERHGHPRLRMRHARVPVSVTMRDAWLRSMTIAMDEVEIAPSLRAYLEPRLAEVANFLRNHPG